MPFLFRPQELKTKKRYGRLQKAMGDYCLLAGSPLDAQDHYSTGEAVFACWPACCGGACRTCLADTSCLAVASCPS